VCPRDTATTLGITERSVLGIVTGLTAAGYVVNDKEAAGRGHRAHGNATDQSDQQHECEAHERTNRPLNPDMALKGVAERWQDLLDLNGEDLEKAYRHTLEGRHSGVRT
jgi:hypothetical protein